jgi:uncharacterized protein YjbI with pentapeptide repeats
LGQGKGYGLAMNDRPDDPESGAGEPKPPKMKAEENEWYLLATLYGVGQNDKNRRAWNRYFAARLDPETRGRLIKEDRHPKDELTPPFLPDDSQEIEKAFAERSKDPLRKPPKSDWLINFKDIQFDEGVRFEKFLFTACSFEGAVFSSARFDKATFSRSINFKKATFHGEADFNGASFRETFPLGAQTDFSGTRFLSAVSFDEAAFAREVCFNGTIFSDETRFRAASFSGKTYFADATFSGQTYFNGATFSWVEFVGHARFDKNVYFDGATFTGETNFTNAIFAAQSTFVNAKMKYDTSFEGTIFEWEPPKFFEAELHEGTNWNAKKWPLPPASIVAKQFVDAYACLKREMD